ncbi:hypothetical protein TWF594_005042 [Orbilia oligospora]|nr:hypothetical protein TWF594_005042 [Orbilia oligospora]
MTSFKKNDPDRDFECNSRSGHGAVTALTGTTPFQNHSNHRRPLHQDREICIAKCLNACSQRSNIGSTTFELTNGIELTYIGCSVHNRDLRIRCHLVFVQQVRLELSCAACMNLLSSNPQLPKNVGTRFHRAFREIFLSHNR